MPDETEPAVAEIEEGGGHAVPQSIEPVSYSENQETTDINNVRLRYLKEEIIVAEELIREVEWGLKGLKNHLKDLTEEQATILSNPDVIQED